MAENAFNENVKYLKKAANEIAKRDKIADEISNLKAQQKKLVKNTASEEKSISDEIAQTIKKRQAEIEKSYDNRLDDNRARKKKVEYKRDKKKNERMNKRIENETRHISQENKELEVELKTLFKKHHVPSFCASHFYYVMFSPNGMGEFLAMAGGFLVYFLAIPTLIAFIIEKLVLEKKTGINVAFWMVLIAAAFIILNMVIYFAVFNSTKNSHRSAINQGRNIWDKIKANNRKISAIRNSINKDKDESHYNLDSFDKKMKNLDDEADDISKEKRKSLRTFEEETTKHIENEIKSRRMGGLQELKDQKKAIEEEISEKQSEYSEQAMLVTKEYGPYLGENLCKYEKVLDMISLMEDGEAKTVSEAIRIYRESN